MPARPRCAKLCRLYWQGKRAWPPFTLHTALLSKRLSENIVFAVGFTYASGDMLWRLCWQGMRAWLFVLHLLG